MAARESLYVHYGAMSLFLTITHNVFLLYYVQMFVSIYKIDKLSFWIGETIFLVWNSINDPLFGWFSDKSLLSAESEGRTVNQPSVVLRRIQALSINGPLFSISFLLFWISWGNPTIQFIVCLCLYDSFLTMVDLHHTALLADLALSATERTKLNGYCSVFSALGSLSVFVSYFFWDRNSTFLFQVFCTGISMFSMIGYFAGSRLLKQAFIEVMNKEDMMQLQSSQIDNKKFNPAKTEVSMKLYINQVKKHKNFMWFTAMNLVQVFHCHFNSNFFPIFLENLLGNHITPLVASLLLGTSFIIPHINNLYFLSLCRRYGVYSVVKGLFFIKLLLSICMLAAGPRYVILLCLFIASNRVFTEGTCKLLNLVVSDLVDEDCVIHHRKQAVSALVFGTSALLSKPGQTLAPLVGTWLLSSQTGHDIFQSGHESGSIRLSQSSSADDKAMVEWGCFQCLVFVPIICAIIQLIAWSQFTLRGRRLQWVKSVRAGSGFCDV
ncbi:transmembrane protein 180-like [Saccoglossus kowalevskii]|uniref:Transmembrane protein 180-like n=1 Tax=Saccoglossus kowalevskii TaxID=10224 RepID=A0ABM0GVR8_SACKO|nr:PREDICTED: transmembrane protein 180-like [Saccoglossus kowalevskii]